MKLDLDELERKARAEIDTRLSAPRSLEGLPLITSEVAEASWAHEQATKPPVVLALIARIRELEIGMADALYWLKPGLADERSAEMSTERERLSALLAKDPAPVEPSAIERIAKAATAFVDEQSKKLTLELLEHDDFATSEWEDLVLAVPEGGR